MNILQPGYNWIAKGKIWRLGYQEKSCHTVLHIWHKRKWMRLCEKFSLPGHPIYFLSSGNKWSSDLSPSQREIVTLTVYREFHPSILQVCPSVFFTPVVFCCPSPFSTLSLTLQLSSLCWLPNPLTFSMSSLLHLSTNILQLGVPGCSVVKNSPAEAGDTGSIPGPRKSHTPWSN